jgi:hypothetical protein
MTVIENDNDQRSTGPLETNRTAGDLVQQALEAVERGDKLELTDLLNAAADAIAEDNERLRVALGSVRALLILLEH